MDLKKNLAFMLRIILVLGLSTIAYTQIRKICEFKDVVIPFDLKNEDSIYEKGTYSFEVRKDVNQSIFHLRIKKRRKAICIIRGEKQMYESFGTAALFQDPNIPDDPKLRFRKVPEEKIVNIIFESGKRTGTYPCIKVMFQMGYEE